MLYLINVRNIFRSFPLLSLEFREADILNLILTTDGTPQFCRVVIMLNDKFLLNSLFTEIESSQRHIAVCMVRFIMNFNSSRQPNLNKHPLKNL